MNNLKKRLISLVLLTCVALSSFAGCSKADNSSKKDSSDSSKVQDDTKGADETTEAGKTDSSEKTTSSPIIDSPFEYVTDANGNVILPMQSDVIGSGNEVFDAPDPEGIDISPSISDNSGQPSTKSVDVTDANGEKVTDSNGNQMTEYVTSSGNSDYQSKIGGNYVLWMDVSKNENFVFNGKFIKITFDINEDIPDGEYPVTFVTDFSTTQAQETNPAKIFPGTITVGGEAKKGEDYSNEKDFILYGDNISCKQGDTVDFYIYTKNNPGLAATLLWFYYDSNAMTAKKNSAKPAGEFAEVTRRVDSDRVDSDS